MFTIYALRDPRDLQIHYVGLTENHPVWRLAQVVGHRPLTIVFEREGK